MLLLNLASKCFYGAYERLFPSHQDSVCEEQITQEHELAAKDMARFRQIKEVWHKVGRDLGVPDTLKVKFAVQLDADTSRAVWHQGTPTIIIPYHYLRKAVVLDQEKAPSWTVWQQFLDKSPDNIEEMVEYTHRFSTGMPKGKLVRLVEQYGNHLSQLELEGELAHEFGHIQAHHLNPTRGNFTRGFSPSLLRLRYLVSLGESLDSLAASFRIVLMRFFRFLMVYVQG